MSALENGPIRRQQSGVTNIRLELLKGKTASFSEPFLGFSYPPPSPSSKKYLRTITIKGTNTRLNKVRIQSQPSNNKKKEERIIAKNLG